MTPPIQLQRMPKRRKKPATVRAFVLFIAAACFAVFCAGLIARFAP